MEQQHHTTIRPYQEGDKAACIVALRSNFPKFFTREELTKFEDWLDKVVEPSGAKDPVRNYYFVVCIKDKIVGSGGFVYSKDKNELNFAWGFIDNAFHKKGLGKVLFNFRLSQMKQLYPTATIILDTTQHSYTFFEKFGFVTEKYTENGYEKGMHRYDMKLKNEA